MLAFFAAQFVAFFNWTNLGVITAVKGAELLRESGIRGVPLIICFIMITCCWIFFWEAPRRSGR